MNKFLEFIPIWLIVHLVWVLPLSCARKFADFLAWILFRLPGLRREVTIENLKRAFPDWEEEKYSRKAASCYKFFTRAGVEWLKFEDVLRNDSFTVDSWQLLDRHRQGGALILTGHLGYWELLGALIARRYGDLFVYADEQSNPYSQSLIDRRRSAMQISTAAGVEGIRELTRRLQKGNLAGFVGDQRPRGKATIVSFFGSPVKSTRIPAVAARRTEVPVLPVFALRSGENEITVKIEEPLPVSRGGVSSGEEKKLLQQYNRVLQDYIKRYPHQYFWLHNRWKGTEKVQERENSP